jgi:hypothetical protein
MKVTKPSWLAEKEKKKMKSRNQLRFSVLYVRQVQLVRFRMYGTRECGSPISPALFHSLRVYV